jgi:hypothetical protein
VAGTPASASLTLTLKSVWNPKGFGSKPLSSNVRYMRGAAVMGEEQVLFSTDCFHRLLSLITSETDDGSTKPHLTSPIRTEGEAVF